MEITINSKQLALNAEQRLDTMDVCNFVKTFGYDIDKLYIDRFWDSISDEQWVVIDYDMLRWMGYDCERDRNNKQKYVNLIIEHFIEHEDYDIVSGEDSRIRYLKVALLKNTPIVSADTFKASLMMLRTEKSKTIRQYYLTLEKIFKDYMRYTQIIKDHNHAIELAQLRIQPPVINIKRTPMRMDKFVYVMTSERAFDQCLFKIGRTNNPCRRLTEHNTAAATNLDTMFYTHTVPCVDPIGLEKTLHQLLGRYHSHNEWYRIPHQHMKRIVELTIKQQQDMINEINACIAETMDSPNNMTIQQFEHSDAKPIPREPIVQLTITDDTILEPASLVPDGNLCDLCRTTLISDSKQVKEEMTDFAIVKRIACPACKDVPEETLARFRQGAKPSFNSNKYQSIRTMIDDEDYCAWLLSQKWFRTKPEYALLSRLYTPKFTHRKQW